MLNYMIILIICIIIFYYIFLFVDNPHIIVSKRFCKDNNKLEQYTNNYTSRCWIDTKLYPEAEYIYQNRNKIKKELIKILSNDKWGIWSEDYNTTPIFSEMGNTDIINRINNNSGKINSGNTPAWRLFGLILNREILETAKECPETLGILLNSSDNILHAGFSLLEPKCKIEKHRDYDNRFYRLQIPLIIPDENDIKTDNNITVNDNLAVLQVEDDYRIYKSTEYFMFDDTCYHNAWNDTDQNRIVLIVDLLKK